MDESHERRPLRSRRSVVNQHRQVKKLKTALHLSGEPFLKIKSYIAILLLSGGKALHNVLYLFNVFFR